MITVKKNNTTHKDTQLKDIIGFALNNGYFFVDEAENYLISFWNNNITCGVTNLTDEGIDMYTTLNELITKLNICDIKDVVAVFTDEYDFTLDLNW